MNDNTQDNTKQPDRIQKEKLASKKLTNQSEKRVNRSIPEKEKLISEVSKYPALWNKEEENYHNREFQRQAWEFVSAETKMTVDEAKATWKNLRDSYTVKLKRVKSGKSEDGLDDVSDGTKAKKWVFFAQMKFLDDAIAPRTTQSNYEDTTDDQLSVMSQMSHDSDQSQLPSPEVVQSCSRTPFHHTPKVVARKRSHGEVMMEQLGKHMQTVSQALTTPDPTNPFLDYLGKIISEVPEVKKRKCEGQLLIVANAYADGNEDSLQVLYFSN